MYILCSHNYFSAFHWPIGLTLLVTLFLALELHFYKPMMLLPGTAHIFIEKSYVEACIEGRYCREFTMVELVWYWFFDMICVHMYVQKKLVVRSLRKGYYKSLPYHYRLMRQPCKFRELLASPAFVM